MKKLFEEDFEVRPDNEQQKRGFEVDLLVAQCDSQAKQNAKVKFWIFALENQDQHNFKIFLGQTKQNRENQKKQKKQKTQFSGGLVFWENQRDLEKTKKNKGLVDGGGSARSL